MLASYSLLGTTYQVLAVLLELSSAAPLLGVHGVATLLEGAVSWKVNEAICGRGLIVERGSKGIIVDKD